MHQNHKRNVKLTGENNIYNKPGTTKNANILVSKNKIDKINKSNSDKLNFRAYRTAITNRNSIYYKVVSFDKQYRGLVYGGKLQNEFTGGLSIFKTADQSKDYKNNYYYSLKNNSDGTLYKSPAWTQYKIGKAKKNGNIISLNSNSSITVKNAIKTSESGKIWYQINSSDENINTLWIEKDNLVQNGEIIYSNTTNNNQNNGSDDNQKVSSSIILKDKISENNLEKKDDTDINLPHEFNVKSTPENGLPNDIIIINTLSDGYFSVKHGSGNGKDNTSLKNYLLPGKQTQKQKSQILDDINSAIQQFALNKYIGDSLENVLSRSPKNIFGESEIKQALSGKEYKSPSFPLLKYNFDNNTINLDNTKTGYFEYNLDHSNEANYGNDGIAYMDKTLKENN